MYVIAKHIWSTWPAPRLPSFGGTRGGAEASGLKELGEELEAGTAAVIVLAESKLEEQLQQAMTRANKLIEKEVDADADELEPCTGS